MDKTTLLIVISTSLLFVGVLLYKALWFFRKVMNAPDDEAQCPDNKGQLRKKPAAESGQSPQ